MEISKEEFQKMQQLVQRQKDWNKKAMKKYYHKSDKYKQYKADWWKRHLQTRQKIHCVHCDCYVYDYSSHKQTKKHQKKIKETVDKICENEN